MTASHSSRALGTIVTIGALALAACSDSPVAPRSATSPAIDGPRLTKVTTTKNGDTTRTTFTLGSGAAKDIPLGLGNKISFPRGAGSVCDLRTSSYGPGTWDAPCVPSVEPVTIYATTWLDEKGLSHSEFQPAMRFVPSDVVLLEMQNKNGKLLPGMRIDFCPSFGCIDEAATDPSVATTLNGSSLTAKRRIKHFSGYMVSVGVAEGEAPEDSSPTYP